MSSRPKNVELFATAPPAPSGRVAEVALDVPVDHAFSYALPAAMDDVAVGARVLVPFGHQKLVGVVLDTRDARPDDAARPMKAVLAVIDPAPVLPAELLGFLREVARYYLAPIGETLALALPALERKTLRGMKDGGHAPTRGARVAPEHLERWVEAAPKVEGSGDGRMGAVGRQILAALRAEGAQTTAALRARWPGANETVKRLAASGLVTLTEKAATRSAFTDRQERDRPPVLTDEQVAAVGRLVAALDDSAAGGQATLHAHLLQGVTGSGKTEVYLHAIAHALSQGRGAVMLVPEIALTPQLVSRFRARFGDEVAVVHSALDPAARHQMWQRLHAGELRVAIGARSALFAPVPDLGLVVVDEEHDPSFKQEEGVRYHARDCALLRAHRAGAVCVLGSATPSLESIELARRGRIGHLRLHQRARASTLPSVEIVDMRRMGPGPSGSKLISLPLHRAIEKTLAAKEQAILFLNRRGFAPAVVCEKCGELVRCPHCDVAMTLHREPGLRSLPNGGVARVPAGLRCHYCDRVTAVPERCAHVAEGTTTPCGGTLVLEGVGTERLEETLTKAFPTARVARLDRDAASGKDVEAVLARMRRREIDLLVGTQMVAKGHDLPHVTLVGVIAADAALSMPDFRAAERTFHLLVQVAGRAGRADLPGRVLLQTRAPEHPAVRFAARHDVEAFLRAELDDRHELSYPPFARLVLVRLDGKDDRETAEAARILARAAAETDAGKSGKLDVLGPTTAPVHRARDRFRWRVLLRGERAEVRAGALAVRQAMVSLPRAVRVVIDVDPVAMM